MKTYHSSAQNLARAPHFIPGKSPSPLNGPYPGFLPVVNVRMSKLVGNFHKNVVEPQRGYTWKKDLNGLR